MNALSACPCYKSGNLARWELLNSDWRGKEEVDDARASQADADERYAHLKDERMPDGRMKRIYRDRETGEIIERVEEKAP